MFLSYHKSARVASVSHDSPLRQTPRTTLRRKPARGSHDRALAYSILDEALHCSVGFVVDQQPYVVPTVFARWDDRLILHGAPASRMLKTAATGAPACVTVTLVDGLVLARSAMHHSLNYRSVVVLGSLFEITSADEKIEAFRRVVEHVVPGRSRACRPPSEKELAATRVLALPIDEASVKVRAGDPLDDEADLGSEWWAGVVPLVLCALPPVADRSHPPPIDAPPALHTYRRDRSRDP